MSRFSIKLRCRFSVKEQTHFAKRLAFLTGGGVTMLESLRILKKQNKSKAKEKIYERMVEDISNGQFLSTSMRKLKTVMSDFAIHIIHVGETSGQLSQNLNYLANELKKKSDLKKKVESAFIYPLFISIATIGITVLLTVFIFPKLLPIFQSIHITLPLSTRVLISTSAFIRQYVFWICLAAIVFIGALTILLKQSHRFSFLMHRLYLRIPVLEKIIKSYTMANFERTLGLLLKSGIVITDALSIAADTTANLVYKKEFKTFSKRVASGDRISKCLSEDTFLFPDISFQMIAIGETTGNLGDTLLYLGELHEGEVDDETRNLASVIEPILMIFMGIVVGFVAISIITPIYEITQNLKH